MVDEIVELSNDERALTTANLIVVREEGCRLEPYRDTEGKLTIGFGHLLEQPITMMDAERYLSEDMDTALEGAAAYARQFNLRHVSGDRMGVLVAMAFQLGRSGLMGFRKMGLALAKSDWQTAADEALDSKWARQTPGRARRMARILLRGQDHGEGP